MDDDGEVTPLEVGAETRARLGRELRELLGLKTDAEVRAMVNRVLVTARRRQVQPDAILAEIRSVKVRRNDRTFQPVNTGVIDRWTGVHFASGVALGLVGVSPAGAVAIGSVFELAEKVAKERRPELFPHPAPDTALNTAGDLVAIGLGAWFTYE